MTVDSLSIIERNDETTLHSHDLGFADKFGVSDPLRSRHFLDARPFGLALRGRRSRCPPPKELVFQ